MIATVFQRQNRLFTLLVLGWFPLLLVMLGLFGVAASQIWENERELRELRREFDRHYALWEQQQIQNYTVTYSNTAATSCIKVTMKVENSFINSTTPTCSNTYYGYYSHGAVRSMQDLFFWIDTYAFDSNFETVEIEYHPQLHYVTRLVIDDPYSASTVEIRYEDLRPDED